MLFYDPLFLTCFPFLYVLYFAAREARTKRWILLIGSGLFYLWGEPLFVPVVVASANHRQLERPDQARAAGARGGAEPRNPDHL